MRDPNEVVGRIQCPHCRYDLSMAVVQWQGPGITMAPGMSSSDWERLGMPGKPHPAGPTQPCPDCGAALVQRPEREISGVLIRHADDWWLHPGRAESNSPCPRLRSLAPATQTPARAAHLGAPVPPGQDSR